MLMAFPQSVAFTLALLGSEPEFENFNFMQLFTVLHRDTSAFISVTFCTLEYLIIVQHLLNVHNRKLDLMWLANKDNLMLLN